jgi:hypothetical protein
MARLAIDKDFLDDYSKLPKPIQNSVKTAIDKFAEHVHAGLHLEKQPVRAATCACTVSCITVNAPATRRLGLAAAARTLTSTAWCYIDDRLVFAHLYE